MDYWPEFTGISWVFMNYNVYNKKNTNNGKLTNKSCHLSRKKSSESTNNHRDLTNLTDKNMDLINEIAGDITFRCPIYYG